MAQRHSTPIRGLTATKRSPMFQGRFGRLFRSLPPATFGRTDKENQDNLAKLGHAMSASFDPPTDGQDPEESAIPALYTYIGQFIDHDVTRTQTALSALNELNRHAQGDANIRGKLAAAGITLDQLKQAIANAAGPTSVLSINTGKLDLDAVYGVVDFSTLTAISAPWFEQRNGAYTGRFAMR